MANPIETLTERGLIQDHTDLDAIREHLNSGTRTFYVGYDPTASSLHVGNLVGLMAMSWLQKAGHHTIALAGGSTGRIGDPSFRDDERSLLDDVTVGANLAGIMKDFGRVLDLDVTTVVDNYSWTKDMTVLEYLRDIGKHFSVNQLISRESVRRRLEDREQGISYTEFSYGLLQALDFDHLFAEFDCTLQLGGSDQWGNILSGVDLIRRRRGERVHALTWPLVEGSDGKKFSKTAGNAPWLDPDQTSPFEYYQWWLNTDDRDVQRFLLMFTHLEGSDIAAAASQHEADPSTRSGQRLLATEATRIVHGDAGLAEAVAATAALFGSGSAADLSDHSGVPSVEVEAAELANGIGLLDLLTRAGATKSNSEARRLVDQGAVRVDDRPISDSTSMITTNDLSPDSPLLIRVGKKRQYLVKLV